MRRKEALTLPLIDILAYRMGVEYLSDLRYLDPDGRERLAEAVAGIPTGAAPLGDWNDALVYLTGAGVEDTPETARAQLLRFLGRSAPANRVVEQVK